MNHNLTHRKSIFGAKMLCTANNNHLSEWHYFTVDRKHLKQSYAPNLELSWTEWHCYAPFYNVSVQLSQVFLKCHIFSLVYGCVFIPAEWAPITRFQRLWQQPSVRKPNTSQLRQCTQAGAHTCTHTSMQSQIQIHTNPLTQCTSTRWKGQFIKPPAKAGLRTYSASIGLEKEGRMCLWVRVCV